MNNKILVAVLLVVALVGGTTFCYAAVAADGAAPKLVADGYQIAEGPAADPQGNVYFADCLARRILKWTTDGKISVFKDHTGGSAGMRFGADRFLYVCEFLDRRVVRYSLNGEVTPVAEKWEGKRLNQPNDLWIDGKGGIYFTDPVCTPISPIELDGEDVFYIRPGRTELVRVATGIEQPNGIVGTPDGKTLYITNGKAMADQNRRIEAFDINGDGSLTNKRTFINEGSDGMVIDSEGHLYLTGKDSIAVYDKSGQLIERIPMPVFTTNLAFAGPNRKTLFITTVNAIYTLNMSVAGVASPKRPAPESAAQSDQPR